MLQTNEIASEDPLGGNIVKQRDDHSVHRIIMIQDKINHSRKHHQIQKRMRPHISCQFFREGLFLFHPDCFSFTHKYTSNR